MSASRIPLLVVDDEPPMRRLLRTSLSAQGYRVLEAATGHQALDLLARETLEVVLLDLGLPDLDGLEVIRRLRASNATIPSSCSPVAATSGARWMRSSLVRTTM